MAGGAVCGLLLLFYAGWLVRGRGRKETAGRKLLAPDWIGPFRQWLSWGPVRALLEPMLHRPRMSLAALNGGSCSPEKLLRWAAESAAMAYAGEFAVWLLAAVSGNPSVGWVGTAAALMIPAFRARDLHRQVESRKQMVLQELPVMLSRLLVLVNAGENVRRALARTLDRRPKQPHPLYDELYAALAAMDRGESMSLAMEEFGRRCGVPEVQLFSAVLLMNVRRGGETLVPALRDLSRQMWDKRKAAARTVGEQASSRLAFPLAVIFLLIMVLAGAPALMMM